MGLDIEIEIEIEMGSPHHNVGHHLNELLEEATEHLGSHRLLQEFGAIPVDLQEEVIHANFLRNSNELEDVGVMIVRIINVLYNGHLRSDFCKHMHESDELERVVCMVYDGYAMAMYGVWICHAMAMLWRSKI
jgi:hypothetical protein